jgi:hypothetical protein
MLNTPRIVSCSLVGGVLFAILTGVSATSEGVGATKAIPSVHTVFSPTFALPGFLFGTPIGAALGFLWGRSRLVGVVGLVLMALLGGLIGITLAAQLGASTRYTVTGTSFSMEHGAPAEVLIGGAALGLIGGALIAWRFQAVEANRRATSLTPRG